MRHLLADGDVPRKRVALKDVAVRYVLSFRTIAIDSHFMPAGIAAGETIDFFRAGDYEEEEVITRKKRSEEEIVKWILDSPARGLLLEELGVAPDSFVDYSVGQPVIENPQEKPGDIDIMICDGGRAERAVALQCKPVSVVAFNEKEDDVNKLRDVKDAVLQANKQRDRYGFYKNYVAIIIKAYGRNREGENTLFRGPSEKTTAEIYEFPQRESLHSDVGIIFIRIVQPTGKSYNRRVNIGVCVDKEAAPLSQPARLTNRIKEHMLLKSTTAK